MPSVQMRLASRQLPRQLMSGRWEERAVLPPALMNAFVQIAMQLVRMRRDAP